ncbi:AraC family transcriptional regulator [Paenibacillus sp.]|uniref:AraC family transcriptional regulator n=1 Tax=Paenibacillus sp. TaxID=58172 RepID=UPI002D6F33A6|nr:AraC family transcriptional regulator [Paenibacillus sp.]HZG55283.1 AraC family transcriptional regulator [Paenibacillus sp.]
MNETLARLLAAKQYVDERLDEDVRLEDVAAAVGCSAFHFHRLFRAWMGVTLAEYVRDRRLQAAGYALKRTNDKLIDIGLSCGFASPETFLRAFKRKYGVTPGDYRRGRGGAGTMKVIIKERQATTAVGVAVRTDVAKDRNIAEAWTRCAAMCEGVPNVKRGGMAFGVELYEPGMEGRAGAFTYVACIETDGEGIAPEGMVALTIPGGRYAAATHIGSTERLQETFDYVYGVWLPESGERARAWPAAGGANGTFPTGRCGFDVEAYDDRYRENDPTSELEIWVPLEPEAKEGSRFG